jgi:hypothetical protein
MTDRQELKPQIVQEGEVLFVIRRTDMNRAIREVRTNCKGVPDANTVYLLVSEYAMTVRAVGMESEYPVNGIRPGTFQMPIAVLRRIISMRPTKEFALHVQQGAISSGSSTVRHPAIRLSTIPDVRVSVPIDASNFDLLVIGRLLEEAELDKQGLGDRIAKARERYQKDIAIASSCLTQYHVRQADLEVLIDRLLKEAEPAVKAAIYA